MKISGELDFGLVGVTAGISGLLAEREINLFLVSTYNPDYILIKTHNFEKAAEILSSNGCELE